MALKPIDDIHALQIQAGTLGRKAGHKFEDEIAEKINSLEFPFAPVDLPSGHVFSGCPANLLLSYVARHAGFDSIPANRLRAESPFEWVLRLLSSSRRS